MEEKKFVGLDGLKYFWTKIEAKVIKIIEDEIAQIIANAPEDLDTLKEIADWISTHEDSASAMNTAILANTEAISVKADKIHTHTKSQITDFDHTHDDRYYTESEVDTKLSGKADKIHTHTKSEITDFPTSLPANGGTADSAKKLDPFVYCEYPYVYDPTNNTRYFVFKIQMVPWFNSTLIQTYSDINYAKSRKYILGLWHGRDGWGYNVSVTDLGGTMNDGLRVWLGNDGNVYLQAVCEWISRISFSYLEDVSDITVEKIGSSRLGSNTDIDGNVLFTPLTDPIIDCGAIRGASDLSSASKEIQYLKADKFIGSTGIASVSNHTLIL